MPQIAANASANTIPQYGPPSTDAQSFDPSVLNAPPTPPVTGPITPSPSMPDAYKDFGQPPVETGTRLVGSQGPMNVAEPNHHRQLEEFLSTGLHLQTVNLWVIPQVHSRQQYQSLLRV
jgi:hypothetical protein